MNERGYDIDKFGNDDVVTINPDRVDSLLGSLDAFNREYDTIVMSSRVSPEERRIYDKVIGYVKHSILIVRGFDRIPFSVIENKASEEKYLGSFKRPIFNDSVTERLVESVERMYKENDAIFSFRFVPMELCEQMVKLWGINEFDDFEELTYYNDVNGKNILFLDSKYDKVIDYYRGIYPTVKTAHCDLISDCAKNFMVVYPYGKLTIIKIG